MTEKSEAQSPSSLDEESLGSKIVMERSWVSLNHAAYLCSISHAQDCKLISFSKVLCVETESNKVEACGRAALRRRMR